MNIATKTTYKLFWEKCTIGLQKVGLYFYIDAYDYHNDYSFMLSVAKQSKQAQRKNLEHVERGKEGEEC